MGYSPWGDKESDTIEQLSARFGSTYTKTGTIQRRLAWALRKGDTQICEVFHIFPLTKEARIYNGEKTISLTSGAGKTG